MSKKTVTNTSDPRHIAAKGSLSWVMGGNPGAIEAQEAAGQQELANSEFLPTEVQGRREDFERMGIVFGDPVEGDPMFTHCTLPTGWKKGPTDHSMWSDLVDDKGRKRAGIFYKAAFYDRSAHMSAPYARIRVDADYEQKDFTFGEVKDGATVLFRTEDIRPIDGEKMWYTRDRACKAAATWADEHFPDWQNATANWDQDELKTA
jgi:hypothetical protein